MDKGTITGLLLGVGGILAGLILEGGNVGQIIQPTAAMIVFGGTFGAVLIQFPLQVSLTALQRLVSIFIEPRSNFEEVISHLVSYANKARRDGIVSLDSSLESIDDPFMKKALMLAVDGTEPQELRKIMEVGLDNTAESEENYARVFESAGGFSPTIGIIGAVLGLIQVMQHLDNIDEVGKGIAVAFVATVYGVGAANLFFLPAAGKLRHNARQQEVMKEMMLEGVISILEGMNPRMLETKLTGYLAKPKTVKDVSGAPASVIQESEPA